MRIRKRQISFLRALIESSMILIFGVVGSLIALPAYKVLHNFNRLQSQGVKTEGQITKYRTSAYDYSVDYEYVVNGKKYQSNIGSTHDFFKKHSDSVTVHYLSDHPDISYADAGEDPHYANSGDFYIGLLMVVLSLLGFIYSLWRFLSGKEIVI
ncbi:MAG TPA: DUF3592 domain-containing protein [Candidatus Saccharimonadales bacterium]|nr:DUF3592 domain-containing protein [Candidatus Saccharimonadales bacterium]